MIADPWNIAALDLDGYLARLGVEARPPGRDALDELHAAHVRTFTFDNIDVLLRRHPGVGIVAVSQKFVGRGRGGYCMEHSTIFAAALERLGYRVERRMGRVGDPATVARTHMVVVASLDGQLLLADPGFGMSLLRPIVLGDGVEDDHGGWRYQVRRHESRPGHFTWELYRARGDGWEFMHAHDESPVLPVDVVVAHHFTSTFPASHFTTGLMLTKHVDGHHVAVSTGAITIRRPGRTTEHRELRDGELRDVLHELAIPLDDEEETSLLARVRELGAAGRDRPLEGSPSARQ